MVNFLTKEKKKLCGYFSDDESFLRGLSSVFHTELKSSLFISSVFLFFPIFLLLYSSPD